MRASAPLPPGAAGKRYVFPRGLLVRILFDMARGRPRSIGADSVAAIEAAAPATSVLGAHHIPAGGPLVVVSNHYERPGLWVGWGAMAINAEVRRVRAAGREIHWIIAREVIGLHAGPLRVPRRWTAAAIGRLALIYALLQVSPREAGPVDGAAALRAAARYLTAGKAVGFMPEATATAVLTQARPGVGRALSWLTRGKVPLLPVGIAESNGVLTATFGDPFMLGEYVSVKGEGDEQLTTQVMGRIARLLRPELRGPYDVL